MMKWQTSACTSAAKVRRFNKVDLENILCTGETPAAGRRLYRLVTTVYDLTMANFGLERGLNDDNCAAGYDEVKAYTPRRGRKITGVSRAHIIHDTAREFADNADRKLTVVR